MTYQIPIEPKFRELNVFVGSIVEVYRAGNGCPSRFARVSYCTPTHVVSDEGVYIEPKDIIAQYGKIVS